MDTTTDVRDFLRTRRERMTQQLVDLTLVVSSTEPGSPSEGRRQSLANLEATRAAAVPEPEGA